MEEFLPPDEYAGYMEVKQALCSLNLMLTTGEHEYTRYGFRQLLEKRSVDIIQPDISVRLSCRPDCAFLLARWRD